MTGLLLVGNVEDSVGRGLAFWKSNTTSQLVLFREEGTYDSEEPARTGPAAAS